MSDDDAGGLVGAFLLLGVAIASTWWWFIVIAVVVLVACVLACIPAHGGGVPVYRRPPNALDEIAETLRRIERSQYSD